VNIEDWWISHALLQISTAIRKGFASIVKSDILQAHEKGGATVSSTLVALCYGSALVLALVLLWRFGAVRWYWHVFSILVALAAGLTPLPEALNTPIATVGVGWVFTFLFIWGIAGPLFMLSHRHPHMRHPHPH
jgi:hypothetical protein